MAMSPLLMPVFVLSLYCSWFECEMGGQPPFIYRTSKNSDILRNLLRGRSGRNEVQGPLVTTKLGVVEGYTMTISETRKIHAFTGVPFGESPTGNLRFRDPVPRRPWKGVLKAKSHSPYCIQASPVTLLMARGQEDCLYLDVFTPELSESQRKNSSLPVIMWIPAGANSYGKSRSYGPASFMRENIILVVINVRFGIFGFMSTGDEACPGNLALKDQSLAVKWVYDNIRRFGGDPRRITIGGISSAAYAAQAMLFTNHETRNYIAGIISVSGSVNANHGVDVTGRVQEASDVVAMQAGCPTSKSGRSYEMVECMRRMDPYILQTKQSVLYQQMPPMIKMLGPTLEPKNVTTAFLNELPEELYKQGRVPPIPYISTRAESETGFIFAASRFCSLPVLAMMWNRWMPDFLQLGLRNAKLTATPEERMESLKKVSQFYFNKTDPPNFFKRSDFINFVFLIDDSHYNAPTWKSIELHHKIAPTYALLNKQNTFKINPMMRPFASAYQEFGSPHGGEFLMLFNNTRVNPPVAPESDIAIASRNLVNIFSNFATYGKPLYRTPSGELLELWKPVDMRNTMTLEVGLVHNISMIRDPLANTRRLRIWEEVVF